MGGGPGHPASHTEADASTEPLDRPAAPLLAILSAAAQPDRSWATAGDGRASSVRIEQLDESGLGTSAAAERPGRVRPGIPQRLIVE
jgi:hypothetical protein